MQFTVKNKIILLVNKKKKVRNNLKDIEIVHQTYKIVIWAKNILNILKDSENIFQFDEKRSNLSNFWFGSLKIKIKKLFIKITKIKQIFILNYKNKTTKISI